MASWWKNKSKQVRLERLADRSYQIYQAQMDETLELIQISLLGLMDTRDAKSTEDIAYRELFNNQYDRAVMDLETIAKRVRGVNTIESTVITSVTDDITQDQSAFELTEAEEKLLQQTEAEAGVEKDKPVRVSAKPINLTNIITRAQAALVP